MTSTKVRWIILLVFWVWTLLLLGLWVGYALAQPAPPAHHPLPPEARAHLLDFLRALFPELATPHSAPVVSYAVPVGSGSACTWAAPCTIQTWLTSPLVVPGATLVLGAGIYTGSAQMLAVPDTFAGTQAQPITIRAETPGTVTLDGQDSRRPAHLAGSWGVLEGVNLTRGDNHNLRFIGDHWSVRAVVVWNLGVHTDTQIAVGGTDNVLEDCAVFGVGQKQIAAGSSQQTPTRNVVRRCVSLWNNTGDSNDPANSLEIGYGQADVTAENNILLSNQTGGNAPQRDAVLKVFRSPGSKLLGNLVVIRATDNLQGENILLFGNTDGGSSHQAGQEKPSTNTLTQHNVAYVDPANPRFAQVRALRFDYVGPPSPHGQNNRVLHNVGVGGLAMTCPSPDWTCTENQDGRTLAEAIGDGKSLWKDSVAAAGVCHRYFGGVLTTAPLWPLPITARLKDAMMQAGQSPVDITQVMEQLFGPIPPACRSDGPPPCVPTCPASVPCGTRVADSCGTAGACPGPVCPSTPPAQALSCTGRLAQIPGTIQMQCLPQTQR